MKKALWRKSGRKEEKEPVQKAQVESGGAFMLLCWLIFCIFSQRPSSRPYYEGLGGTLTPPFSVSL